MGHHCDYIAELVSTPKDIYFKLHATYKDKCEYVYKESISGKAKVRYIYYTRLAGYVVVFPGEKLNYGGKQPKETMGECHQFEMYRVGWSPRQKLLDLIKLEQYHPELKYFIWKQQISNIYTFMKVLRVYIEHPEIEPLLELRLHNIILDKRLFKLTPKKRKEVIRFINQYKDELADETTLTEILAWMKYGYGNSIKDIQKHKDYGGIVDYLNNEEIIGKFRVFIPNDIQVCERQANELHQCIMRCDYVKDMAKKKLVLIFMTKLDGTPVATCEINNKTKEIKQFYANELDRENCLPTKTMKKAMNTYIERLDLNRLYVGA